MCAYLGQGVQVEVPLRISKLKSISKRKSNIKTSSEDKVLLKERSIVYII